MQRNTLPVTNDSMVSAQPRALTSSQPSSYSAAPYRFDTDDHAQSGRRLLDSFVTEDHSDHKTDVQAPTNTKTWRQKYLSGRTVSLRFLATCVAVTLGLNIAIYAYALAHRQEDSNMLSVAQASCSTIKKLDLGLHAVINVLGILLLAAVGTFMTALASPTRAELNRAHSRGAWLDIGIPSVRNLKHIHGLRAWMFVILFLCSLPIHVLYNSIIYTNESTTSFYWLIVTEEFLEGASFNASGVPARYYEAIDTILPHVKPKIDSMQEQALSSHVVLDAKDCLREYSNIYISTYSDLIMVSSSTNANNSLLAWDISLNSNSAFLCAPIQGYEDIEAPSGSDTICNFRALKDNSSTWTSFGHPIRECLARPVNLSCSLVLDRTLTTLMIVCNAAVLAIMLLALTFMWPNIRRTLTCFGDVVSGYLTVEDEHSRGMCLADKARIDHFWCTRGQVSPLSKKVSRWYKAMSRGRLILLLFLLFGGFTIIVIFVAYTLYIVHSDRHLSITPSGLAELGFGSTSNTGDLSMNLTDSVTSLAILSNVPQIFLAIITLVVNAALIEMTQAAEYASFSLNQGQAKQLRVSEPYGSQRGTYLLSMPYRYALPMQIITAALHWTVSQSIIPINVTSSPTDGTTFDFADTSDLVFSPLAILASLGMAGVLLIVTLSFAFFRKLPAHMPLGSSCSLVISAAVHPNPVTTGRNTQLPAGIQPLGIHDPYLPYKRLRWGPTHYSANGTGHMSFAAADKILALRHGKLYS